MFLVDLFNKHADDNLRTISEVKENISQSQLYINMNTITLSGWVKTYRNQQDICFFSINDGSCIKNIQIIVDSNCNLIKSDNIEQINDNLSKLSIGASIELKGLLVKPPINSTESIEIHLTEILYTGLIEDKQSYIISKGRVKPDVMRKHQHIRCKTNLFSNLMKVRSMAMYSVHQFFHENHFYHLDPNVITTSDCEGAGEVFEIVAPTDKCKGGKEDFFNKNAYLTVSSQLQLEALCSGLGRCYTTNPSFRAEKSDTCRHLASFTHIEYELSFCGLTELLDISENMIKCVIKKCLHNCEDEYKFIDKFYSKNIISRLQTYLENDFPRISYDEALTILQDAIEKKELIIDNKDMPLWGDDLGSVCERFLAEFHFKLPVMVYNYPKKLKSFYMKEDKNNPEVVNCMDLLVPCIGELIGSSVREDDYQKIISNMDAKKIDKKPLNWYLDLRKNGSWRHAGGGLGFERLVGMLTMDSNNFNVRDCIPFPVSYGECDY